MFGIDDALAAAAMAAGASIWGASSANKHNRDINKENNTFNAQQADLNRQWQERMSNTAYQRARKDMEAAGFNPILAAGATGATTPSGSSASAQQAAPQQSTTHDAISSAKDAAMFKAQLEYMHAQTEAEQQKGKMYGWQANLNQVNMNNAVTQGSILENQLPASSLQAHIDKGKYGLALAYAKRLNIDVGTAINLVKMLPTPSLTKIKDFYKQRRWYSEYEKGI